MKGFIVFLILAGSAASAFFFHEEARMLYMRTYYQKVKKVTPAAAEKTAEKLFRDKKFVEAAGYSRDMLVIYPGNPRLLRIAGLANLSMSNRLSGARYLIPVLTGSPEDRVLLRGAVETLYEERYYSDIINLLEKHSPGSDPALTFYMGASLAGTGRYSEALPYLEKSESRGSNNPDVYYFLGYIHEKRGKVDAAIENYREALKRNRFHNGARKALLDVYTKKGMFREAEILIRGRVY